MPVIITLPLRVVHKKFVNMFTFNVFVYVSATLLLASPITLAFNPMFPFPPPLPMPNIPMPILPMLPLPNLNGPIFGQVRSTDSFAEWAKSRSSLWKFSRFRILCFKTFIRHHRWIHQHNWVLSLILDRMILSDRIQPSEALHQSVQTHKSGKELHLEATRKLVRINFILILLWRPEFYGSFARIYNIKFMVRGRKPAGISENSAKPDQKSGKLIIITLITINYHSIDFNEHFMAGDGVNIGNQVRVNNFASIANNAVISDDSIVDQFTSIGQNVQVQPRAYVGMFATIEPNAIISESVIIGRFARVRGSMTVAPNGIVVHSPSTMELYQLCAPTVSPQK